MGEWQLPDDGNFSFDYIMPRLPLDSASAVHGTVLAELLLNIEESPCNLRDRVAALRLVAHLLVLLPEQLQLIVELFPKWYPFYEAGTERVTFRPRTEAYITCYNCTLFHSEVVSPSLLYNPAVFHADEARGIRKRVGWIHAFDLVNCHAEQSNLGNRHGPISMVTYDGWIVLKLLIAVSMGEYRPNFEDTLWSEKKDLYERGYPFIVPATWVPDPPRIGEFTSTFQSKADDIHPAKRRELAAKYLGWTFRSFVSLGANVGG